LIRKAFARTLILNSDFTPELAKATVADGQADAITFGRPFIANPDLPRRIAEKLPLATAVVPTYYSRGPEGYVDYSFADVAVPAA
jgi:N-ethylmaleimide reductase